jgi:hypothetical protein
MVIRWRFASRSASPFAAALDLNGAPALLMVLVDGLGTVTAVVALGN